MKRDADVSFVFNLSSLWKANGHMHRHVKFANPLDLW